VKSDFGILRGQSESIRIRQPLLESASAIYHILRGDAVVCRLLKVEKDLGALLDQWKEKSDLAVMMNYGGHLARASSTSARMVPDLQVPFLPVLEVPASVSAGVSMDTLSSLGPQIQQPVQSSAVDNNAYLDVLQPLPTMLPRSLGSCVLLRRRGSSLNAHDQDEDNREYLTMCTSNTTVPKAMLGHIHLLDSGFVVHRY